MTAHRDLESGQQFNVSLDDLSALHDPKSLKQLIDMGGLNSVLRKLDTDASNGLPSNTPDLDIRTEKFGKNFIPQKAPKSFLGLCWEAMHDKILIMLSIAAVVSLALGLYETFGQPTTYDAEGKPQPKVEWVEGVAIIVAILIVVIVGAVNDYNKERQFLKLNAKKEDRNIIVFRSGEKLFLPIGDLLVGDLIYVETGDIIPGDSILVQGSCECDESSLTGETNTIKKIPADIALQQYEEQFGTSLETTPDIGDKQVHDPFLISGSKLLGGQGKAIVTAIGPNSMHGKIMLSLAHEPESTPLQERLDALADGIAKFGMIAAGILFFVLLFKFCAKINGAYKSLNGADKGTKFVNVLITAITIVVVAVPEGLPLAVTLALAFATTRMTKDGNLVRVLKSCETMGGATAVCSDKTGTLTENRMKVVKGYLGDESFDDTANSTTDRSEDIINGGRLDNELIQSITANIILNSTAFENKNDTIATENDSHKDSKGGILSIFKGGNKSKKAKANEGTVAREDFVGSKTESALLLLAKDQFHSFDTESLRDLRERGSANVAQVIPFESSRKWGGIVVKTGSDSFRFYIKGASELVLSRCNYKKLANGEIVPITTALKEQLNSDINGLAEDALRTLCLAHSDFTNVSQWPPTNLTSKSNPAEADPDLLFGDIIDTKAHDINISASSTGDPEIPKIVVGDSATSDSKDGLVLDCIVGIQDPLRAGVKNAVAQCYKAGVRVRMVTGDNIITARAISYSCGILNDETKNDPRSCMEGPVFRKLTKEERDDLVPHLCVLARSSPEDKRILVDTLRKLGEVVAVTGDGTNDAPALKLADVGFSMGIAGTEVAREASDIILMNDDFGSIVNAIKWGRTVATSIRKFVQFQLTVNVTAVVLTFISAVASSDNDSVLTAVQLLWVNLIMDTLAALALATDKPDENVLNRKPTGRNSALISTSMWKMIMGQSIVQLIITFVLHFGGTKIFFGSNPTDHQTSQINALTFNTFVWLQFFNLFLTRKLDEGDGITSVRKRITRENLDFTQHFFSNWYFIAIAAIIGGFQILIMFVGGAAFSITRQTGGMWATAIICGLVSMPAGILIRIIPDIWVERIFPTRFYNWLIDVCTLKSFRKKYSKSKDDIEKGTSDDANGTQQHNNNNNANGLSHGDDEDDQYLTVGYGAKAKNFLFNRSRSSSSSDYADSTLWGGSSTGGSIKEKDVNDNHSHTTETTQN